MNSLDLTVKIPAYNKEENLSSTLENIKYSLNKAGLTTKIVIVNDGDSD